MTKIADIEAANAQYAASFTKGHLPIPPKRKLAVVTCMDARIDVFSALGLTEGDAHIIRNAGGRASEALRSLIISQRLLGTEDVVVIHHTDCGMLTFSDGDIRAKIREELGEDASDIKFLPFGDLEESVREDVRFLRGSRLVQGDVTGYVYEVERGRLVRLEVSDI
ncbi:beta-class carbonic anhydrase [Aspergillus fischeri NRRL 181]|uniref:Carbonic anhydrase n=1 Tax=Neosartorya fischeri (strain ATCC 1020 / DSM 3700 / CBS 544.65 / FGSC A1164 / JCM 1740 / NRRL 181 / WB 181) TaxID=331117 RepID=A1CX19_NEOFI|nr:carbonic anhydrase, putative [Aspergillus fischeri NRRL 181]EAW25171.1 carbonic anhydrase, putative [Aspergillus fischeri NRRL 181]